MIVKDLIEKLKTFPSEKKVILSDEYEDFLEDVQEYTDGIHLQTWKGRFDD